MADDLSSSTPLIPRNRIGRNTYLIPLRFISIATLLISWQLLSVMPWAIAIPSPVAVVKAGLQLEAWRLLVDISLSFYRVVSGFLLAAAVAIPFGIWIGYSKLAHRAFFPLLEVLRPIPPIAWIPLAILFFVEAESMILFLTFLGAFFPIAYNTIAGITSIKPMYIQAATSLGARGPRLFLHVILPAMLPVIFAGLQVAVGTSWLMVVAAEMMASKGGVGAMTWQAFQTSRYPLVFVGMAVIGTLGYLSSSILRAVGTRLVRWRTQ